MLPLLLLSLLAPKTTKQDACKSVLLGIAENTTGTETDNCDAGPGWTGLIDLTGLIRIETNVSESYRIENWTSLVKRQKCVTSVGSFVTDDPEKKVVAWDRNIWINSTTLKCTYPTVNLTLKIYHNILSQGKVKERCLEAVIEYTPSRVEIKDFFYMNGPPYFKREEDHQAIFWLDNMFTNKKYENCLQNVTIQRETGENIHDKLNAELWSNQQFINVPGNCKAQNISIAYNIRGFSTHTIKEVIPEFPCLCESSAENCGTCEVKKLVKNGTFNLQHPTTTSCSYGPGWRGELNISSLMMNSGIKENTYSHSLNWTSLVVHPKCVTSIDRNVNGDQYKKWTDPGPHKLLWLALPECGNVTINLTLRINFKLTRVGSIDIFENCFKLVTQLVMADECEMVENFFTKDNHMNTIILSCLIVGVLLTSLTIFLVREYLKRCKEKNEEVEPEQRDLNVLYGTYYNGPEYNIVEDTNAYYATLMEEEEAEDGEVEEDNINNTSGNSRHINWEELEEENTTKEEEDSSRNYSTLVDKDESIDESNDDFEGDYKVKNKNTSDASETEKKKVERRHENIKVKEKQQKTSNTTVIIERKKMDKIEDFERKKHDNLKEDVDNNLISETTAMYRDSSEEEIKVEIANNDDGRTNGYYSIIVEDDDADEEESGVTNQEELVRKGEEVEVNNGEN